MKYFISLGLLLFATVSHALPFTITRNGNLPTTVLAESTAVASYTIQNNTSITPPSNLIKWLPPNVQINPTGTTCAPTAAFALASGQSCILNLIISGAIDKNDPSLHNHLLICMSDGVTCAGPNPENSLNVRSCTSASFWESPPEIAQTTTATEKTSQILSDTNGTLYAAWTTQDASDNYHVYFSTRSSLGSWSTPQDLSGSIDTLAAPRFNLAIDGKGYAAVGWMDVNNDLVVTVLSNSTIATDATTLASSIISFNLAGNPSGGIGVVWNKGFNEVATKFWTPTQSWSAPQTVTNASINSSAQLAFDQTGNAVVVYFHTVNLTSAVSIATVNTAYKAAADTGWTAAGVLGASASLLNLQLANSGAHSNYFFVAWHDASANKIIYSYTSAYNLAWATEATVRDLSTTPSALHLAAVEYTPGSIVAGISWLTSGGNVQVAVQPTLGGSWTTYVLTNNSLASSPFLVFDDYGNAIMAWLDANSIQSSELSVGTMNWTAATEVYPSLNTSVAPTLTAHGDLMATILWGNIGGSNNYLFVAQGTCQGK